MVLLSVTQCYDLGEQQQIARKSTCHPTRLIAGSHAGTNACYMELLGRITKWLPHYRPRTSDMVVNIEWPGFQVCKFPSSSLKST